MSHYRKFDYIKEMLPKELNHTNFPFQKVLGYLTHVAVSHYKVPHTFMPDFYKLQMSIV